MTINDTDYEQGQWSIPLNGGGFLVIFARLWLKSNTILTEKSGTNVLHFPGTTAHDSLFEEIFAAEANPADFQLSTRQTMCRWFRSDMPKV